MLVAHEVIKPSNPNIVDENLWHGFTPFGSNKVLSVHSGRSTELLFLVLDTFPVEQSFCVDASPTPLVGVEFDLGHGMAMLWPTSTSLWTSGGSPSRI